MTNLAHLTAEQAGEAFEAFVLPGIQLAMHDDHVNRQHLHIVVLKPGVPYEENADLPILFEYSIGDKAEWERWDGLTFDDYARGKAHLTWRTGLPSREVVLTKPHLLRPGDCRLWGSSIHNGVITGTSGVQPFFDEMFSTMTSAAMIGEASYYADQMDQEPDAPDFLQH